jgi:hypothetical protein
MAADSGPKKWNSVAYGEMNEILEAAVDLDKRLRVLEDAAEYLTIPSKFNAEGVAAEKHQTHTTVPPVVRPITSDATEIKSVLRSVGDRISKLTRDIGTLPA